VATILACSGSKVKSGTRTQVSKKFWLAPRSTRRSRTLFPVAAATTLPGLRCSVNQPQFFGKHFSLRVADHCRRPLRRFAEHRRWTEISVLQHRQVSLQGDWTGWAVQSGWRVAFPFAAGQRDLQFHATAASATPAAAARSGDPDVPGWNGDPGDGNVPGAAAASTTAATSCARAWVTGAKPSLSRSRRRAAPV